VPTRSAVHPILFGTRPAQSPNPSAGVVGYACLCRAFGRRWNHGWAAAVHRGSGIPAVGAGELAGPHTAAL